MTIPFINKLGVRIIHDGSNYRNPKYLLIDKYNSNRYWICHIKTTGFVIISDLDYKSPHFFKFSIFSRFILHLISSYFYIFPPFIYETTRKTKEIKIKDSEFIHHFKYLPIIEKISKIRIVYKRSIERI